MGREATPLAWSVLDLLRGMAADKDYSVSQLAFAWCAAQPGVTAPIIGPRAYEQVLDNVGAVDVQLEATDYERIDALVPPSGYAVRHYDGAGYADFRPHSSRSVV